MFSKQLNEKLNKYHLLNHPFYKSWNDGKLTREIIKDYAEQYYQHVKAFPRYISATHSLCEDIEKRKILLENLQDEESKDGDHPSLWRDFAFAMGSTKEEVESAKEEKFTTELIDNFFTISSHCNCKIFPKFWMICSFFFFILKIFKQNFSFI